MSFVQIKMINERTDYQVEYVCVSYDKEVS